MQYYKKLQNECFSFADSGEKFRRIRCNNLKKHLSLLTTLVWTFFHLSPKSGNTPVLVLQNVNQKERYCGNFKKSQMFVENEIQIKKYTFIYINMQIFQYKLLEKQFDEKKYIFIFDKCIRRTFCNFYFLQGPEESICCQYNVMSQIRFDSRYLSCMEYSQASKQPSLVSPTALTTSLHIKASRPPMA